MRKCVRNKEEINFYATVDLPEVSVYLVYFDNAVIKISLFFVVLGKARTFWYYFRNVMVIKAT